MPRADQSGYIAIPVDERERQLLLEAAQRNERDIAQEVRWRLRRVLRARTDQTKKASTPA
jgi:hypothetical protein